MSSMDYDLINNSANKQYKHQRVQYGCVTSTETFLSCAYLRNDQMTKLPRDMISPSYRASITINQIRSKCSQ